MEFKTVIESVDWTDKNEWLWPAADEKMLGAFYMSDEISKVVRHVSRRRVVVQAGGDAGVWPLRLSQLFDIVYTFEPQEDNFHCLKENCRGIANILHYRKALTNHREPVEVVNTISDRNNYGAGFIRRCDYGIPGVLIDDLDLIHCDLIYLDIEGGELDALKGAAETIERHRPVICVEDKHLPWMGEFHRKVGDPGKYLMENFGYDLIDRIHWDWVYKC